MWIVFIRLLFLQQKPIGAVIAQFFAILLLLIAVKWSCHDRCIIQPRKKNSQFACMGSSYKSVQLALGPLDFNVTYLGM